jgi:serine/threonine-protein kinase HipA
MFTAVRNLIGSATDDLFAVLAATGADAIGDVDVRVPGEGHRMPTLALEAAAQLIDALLEGRRGLPLEHLSAIPGVQPKLSIGAIVRTGRTASFIAKFASPDFPHLLENEFAFMRLAKRCRLNVANVRLTTKALIVQRFDRRPQPGSRGFAKEHVEDMLQVMDRFPNSKYSMEYDEILAAMRALGVSKATLLNALRLYVFSYVIGNGDLHAKNVSLLLDKNYQQWSLSPAYDLLSTLPYTQTLSGADRMALALHEESFGRFTRSEFIEFGMRFGLPERAVDQMVERIAHSALQHLREVKGGFLSKEMIETIRGRAESLQVKG